MDGLKGAVPPLGLCFDWQARPMPVRRARADAADAELRALLKQLRERGRQPDGRRLTYDYLHVAAGMSRGSVGNYLTAPGHGRDPKVLRALLDALGASPQDQARALQLNLSTLPSEVDPGEV